MNYALTNYNNILKNIAPNKLIVVTKTINEDCILPILEAGHILFGENKVQEATLKWASLKQKYNICLHMLGSLQSNKIKQAVEIFDVIQSLDKEKNAKLLAEHQEKIGKYLDYYIQVNTGEEIQKSGVAPQDTYDFVNFCRELKLNIKGLMCVPPANKPSGIHFALLKKLATECNLPNLSMGMSQDYKTAIQFGASYIRIGTAIFGERK